MNVCAHSSYSLIFIAHRNRVVLFQCLFNPTPGPSFDLMKWKVERFFMVNLRLLIVLFLSFSIVLLLFLSFKTSFAIVSIQFNLSITRTIYTPHTFKKKNENDCMTTFFSHDCLICWISLPTNVRADTRTQHSTTHGQQRVGIGIDTCTIINVANIIFMRENWSTIQFLSTLANEMEFQSSFAVLMKSFAKWIWMPMTRCKQCTSN